MLSIMLIALTSLSMNTIATLAFIAPQRHATSQRFITVNMALGEFTVALEKPLGVILEERGENADSGVLVESLVEDGNAASASIAPGDVLVRVNNQDVSTMDFDSVMGVIQSQPESPLSLTWSDGLGSMDIAANLAKRLSTDEAIYADATVRTAVRQLRRQPGRNLGHLQRVEIVIGAAVQKNNRCLVRFFGLFSTDGGVTTYSCNVSATGVRQSDNDGIEIVALSCAKDEGLGQTIDLIVEQ